MMRFNLIRPSICAAILLASAWTSAFAGTNTDNFTTSRNYLTNGVVGTIWEGLYPGGTNDIPNFTGMGAVAGSSSLINANTTTAGTLTVQAVHTDWENGADDGFLMYKVVTGDFDVSVFVTPPVDVGNFNYQGLMVRAFGPGGAPIQPTNNAVTENYLMWGRFGQFGFANMLTPNINGNEADTALGVAGNTNYWLRIQRTNNDFNFYESPTNGGWILVGTSTRADFNGVPLQVGVAQADYGNGTTRTARFSNFVLSGPNVGIAGSAQQVTGLTINTNGATNTLGLTWTAGVGSSGTVVYMRTTNVSRQPSFGITNSGNASFGSGQNLGGSNFIVFAGSGTSVTVSNLNPGVRYFAAAFAYSGSGTNINYNLTNPPTASALAPGILVLQSVAMAVNPTQVAIGSGGQSTVTGTYVGGSTSNVTTLAAYSSGNTNIVTVAADGSYKGVGIGTATITATFQTKQDSKTITVVDPVLYNLVHRYSFTSDARDSIGGADGILMNGAVISNGAVVLDGVASFVDLPDNLVTNCTNASFEVWVTDTGSSSRSRIYDLGNNTNNYVYLSLPNGSILSGGYRNLGASEQSVAWNGGRPPVGVQSHIVWTSDTVSHTGVLYVDGVQVGIFTNLTATPAGMGATTNDFLGKSQFATDPFFQGRIDEFRIYTAALSSNRVLANFQSGPNVLPTAVSNVSGLTHRWTFSETSGTNVADSVGGATGTVITGVSPDFTWTNGSVRLAGGARATADYVQFPGDLLQGLTSVTVETWAKPLSFQNWSRIWDFGPGNDTQVNDFFLSFARGAGGNQQRLEYGAPAVYTIDTALVSATNQQYHYVTTWNSTGGTNGGGVLAWYRDGVLAGSMNTAVGITVSNVNDTVLWLGRSQYPDPTANADFNDLRIYNRALTRDEINFSRITGPDTLVVAPPIAGNDSVTLNPGAQVLLNVLQNDTGTVLNPATVTVGSGPFAGTAQVKPDGKILYTHNGGPATNDQFTYTVQDAFGTLSTPGTVSITISSALRLPNTTVTVPNSPPPVTYSIVDAFPTLTGTNVINQALAMRTPTGAAYSNMLFIVERRGYVSYIPDVTSPNPTRELFLNVSNQMRFDNSATDGEQGLMSLAFHPGFRTNGIFFISYIAPTSPWQERLSRFTANPTNLTVDTNTQVVLFTTTKRAFNHNGGDIHFGLDGYLYMCMGDEGDQYNPYFNAQRLDKSVYSGILRIDVDKKVGNLEPLQPQTNSAPFMTIPTNGSGQAFYSIPSDNPFLGVTNLNGAPVDTNHLRGEFYAIGMRHPWRFSIDPLNGEIWVGIVGQDSYEEVDVLKKGGNYGWPYYEGTHLTIPLYGTGGHPGLSNPPPGFVRDGPLYEYPHTAVADPATPDFRGLDVNGSLVYHGSKIPELANAYLFGDFDAAGNMWALRRITTNSVTVERLAGEPGLSAFAADPSNGDPLMANYLQNKLRRLVRSSVTNSTFPAKLSDTGVFADLATLAPNPGIVAYQPNVTFWSDYAVKQRWFTIPDLTNTVGFAQDGNWTLPTGMKWIKHFDLELERGNPATKKRIETRILVKTEGGIFGVSYKWNDTQDEAILVPDNGDFFTLTVTNNGVPESQDWEIPSRSACLACHTPVAGFALTFNTREMNKVYNMNGLNGNQISSMSDGGYFSAPVPNPHTLPAFAAATDTNYSLEYRVRSFLSVNCVQCHQPGGAGVGWDARAFLTLAQTGLINGTPIANDGGNPANKLIVPGDTNHSVLLMRLENTNGFSRMPPLATHELDYGSIQLVQNWITTELPGHLTYQQWIALYPGLSGPAADPNADPDGDGANNFFEYLTGTNPQSAGSKWQMSITSSGGTVQVSYPQVPNVGVVIETSPDLVNWTPWDVAGNQPVFALSSATNVVSGPVVGAPPDHFFRARLIQP